MLSPEFIPSHRGLRDLHRRPVTKGSLVVLWVFAAVACVAGIGAAWAMSASLWFWLALGGAHAIVLGPACVHAGARTDHAVTLILGCLAFPVWGPVFAFTCWLAPLLCSVMWGLAVSTTFERPAPAIVFTLIGACTLASVLVVDPKLYGTTPSWWLPMAVWHVLSAGALPLLAADARRGYRAWMGEVCPGCGYELRGLRDPVCPECGGEVRI